ncbi:hypothetical protein KJ966_12405 [bacterium]|nr:hypothetical protein [bacterium]
MKSKKIIRIRALFVNEDKSATDECIVLIGELGADGKIIPDKQMFGYHDEYNEDGVLLKWPFVSLTDKSKKKIILNYGDVHADPDECKGESPDKTMGCQYAELIFSAEVKLNTIIKRKVGEDIDDYQIIEIQDY